MRVLWAMIYLWMLCASPVVFAKHHYFQPTYNTYGLITEINRAIGSSYNAEVGILIKSMQSGQTIYSKNEQRLFVPASILKVVTAQAALLYLGGEFRFTTTLLTDAKSWDNGVLNGNVYLVHSGDPSLTSYDFLDLMAALKSQKIHQINGNVYIDNTAYDQSNYGPGWVWTDKRFCFAAPINASIINHNCISFRVLPGKKAGHRTQLVAGPKNILTGINNTAITKATRSRACNLRLVIGPDNAINVTGCMPKGNYARGASTVVKDIMQYNQTLLSELFRSSGIKVTGHILAGIAPPNLATLAMHQSKPLHTLMNDMLKMSDNIIAGSLFKKVGAFYSNHPGSWENGSMAVKQILRKAGVDTDRMTLIDGSGLSRYNKITPSQVMQILEYAFHNNSTNYEFISALPIAGVDGTLRHRLKNIAWKVRAKTGTMSGVRSLAGYAITKDKEPLAFVIIVNGNGGGWKYKEMEDKIVTALTRYSRNV